MTSLIGRESPPTRPYEVSREKLREFADAIGDPNPAYRDPEAARALGHPDVIAPPTFAITLTLDAADPILSDLGFDISQVVHGDQRFVHARPIVAGDLLTTVTVLEAVKPVAGNQMISLRSDVRAADGGLVVSAYCSLVVRPDAL